MFRSKLTKRAVCGLLLTGILLTGCGKNSKIPLLDEEGMKTLLGVDSVSIKTHDPAEVSQDGYTLKDKVSLVYKAPILDGMLDQAVGKEAEFMYKNDTGSWELKSLTLTFCEVDTTNIPGSSWKCDQLSSAQIKALFGDKVPSDGSGTVYIRFLKKMGMFSFNLTNPKNTDSERFFETVGTNVKIVFVGPSGTVESKASVTGGSVTDSGDLKLDLETDAGAVNLAFGKDAVSILEREYDEATGNEVAGSKVYMDTLPVFEIKTTSIKDDGEWKTECGLKEGNLSPALSWQPVDGASKYAVVMIDITTTRWLYWYTIVDKTDLAEGEFTDPKVYTGPYPAGTHTYEIHVIALKSEPKAGTFKVDARSGDIHSFFDYVNTASDGSVGNVVAYGTIKAPYTSPELYYGYR